MKKYFRNKTYDTETATKVAHKSLGIYETEELYCSPNDTFFVLQESTDHGDFQKTKSIKVLGKVGEEDVIQWLENDNVVSICLEDYFTFDEG